MPNGENDSRLRRSSVGPAVSLGLAMYLAGTLSRHGFEFEHESRRRSSSARNAFHGQSDESGRSKAQSAKDTISEINPFGGTSSPRDQARLLNALDILKDYEPGTDNFPTRSS